MPEKVTKKQVIAQLKTPYSKLEIGGEEFTENNQHRHNWGFRVWYEYLSIEANPLANAWNITDYRGTVIETRFSEVLARANSYLRLNRLTWDCWEYTNLKPSIDYPHPKSWTHLASLFKLGTQATKVFYRHQDCEFEVSYSQHGWDFYVKDDMPPINLIRASDIMANIRRLSERYSLSASDWCYITAEVK